MTSGVDTRNAYRPMSQEMKRRSLRVVRALRGHAFLILVKVSRFSRDQHRADLCSRPRRV